jgi:hypothetical protein
MIEDFTYVQSEDKVRHYASKQKFTNQIYDLTKANEASKYYRELRAQIEAIEINCRKQYHKRSLKNEG